MAIRDPQPWREKLRKDPQLREEALREALEGHAEGLFRDPLALARAAVTLLPVLHQLEAEDSRQALEGGSGEPL